MTLTVLNREALQQRARALPVIEGIVRDVVSAKEIYSIEGVSSAVCASPGWIVLQDGKGGGVAINILGVESSCTALRGHVVYARGAQRLVQWIRGIPLSGFTLREGCCCPEGWSTVRVATDRGAFFYGASENSMSAARSSSASEVPPRVALRVVGTCVALPDWVERGYVEVDRMACEIESQRVRGSLCVHGESRMAIHVEEEAAVWPGDRGVLIRLDLGDIELSLDEVVALRAGSVIELAGTEPLRCYMRIGSTVLAEAEIAVTDARIVVRVVSTIS